MRDDEQVPLAWFLVVVIVLLSFLSCAVAWIWLKRHLF